MSTITRRDARCWLVGSCTASVSYLWPSGFVDVAASLLAHLMLAVAAHLFFADERCEVDRG